MTEFAKRLTILQREKMLTQREMANKSGVKKSNITNWMCGKSMPNSENLIKLCKYFDVSADWLLGLSNFRKVKR